jgi:ferredoxin
MEAAIEKAHGQGIGVFSMKPLGGGNLFKRAADCLDYIWNAPAIDSVAIGMQSVEEVDANLAFLEQGRFPPEAAANLSCKGRNLHIDNWCTGCGACVATCGQNALSIREGKAVCDGERCILCGYCSAVCPEWAIKVV